MPEYVDRTLSIKRKLSEEDLPLAKLLAIDVFQEAKKMINNHTDLPVSLKHFIQKTLDTASRKRYENSDDKLLKVKKILITAENKLCNQSNKDITPERIKRIALVFDAIARVPSPEQTDGQEFLAEEEIEDDALPSIDHLVEDNSIFLVSNTSNGDAGKDVQCPKMNFDSFAYLVSKTVQEKIPLIADRKKIMLMIDKDVIVNNGWNGKANTTLTVENNRDLHYLQIELTKAATELGEADRSCDTISVLFNVTTLRSRGKLRNAYVPESGPFEHSTLGMITLQSTGDKSITLFDSILENGNESRVQVLETTFGCTTSNLVVCEFPSYGPATFDATCTYRMFIMAMRIAAARLTNGDAVKWFVEDPNYETLLRHAQEHLTVASALIPPWVDTD